jgi:hypothetical protein
MKKQILVMFLCLGVVSNLELKAQWLPTNATTGNIYYNNGNVGIGTSTPGSKLFIEGSSSNTLGLTIFNTIYGNNQGTLLLFKAGSSYVVTDQRNAGVIESYNDLILSAASGTGVSAPSIKFQTGRDGTDGLQE